MPVCLTAVYFTWAGVSAVSLQLRDSQAGPALFPCSDYGAAAQRRHLGPDAHRRSSGQLPQEAALHALPLLRSQPARGPGEVPAVQGGSAGEMRKG